MIEPRADYRSYVHEDMEALGVSSRFPLVAPENSMAWPTDPIARWERLLRRAEYWENCRRGALWKPVRTLLRWRFQRESARLGFSVPLNVRGPGLTILHYRERRRQPAQLDRGPLHAEQLREHRSTPGGAGGAASR